MMGAALVEVSQVPPGQLNELDNEWAQHVRELSYDMEDAVDEFMVRVYRCEPASGNEATIFKKIAQRTVAAMRKFKSRRQISNRIKDIRDLSKELSELRAMYKFSGTSHSTNPRGVDPRVINMYKNKGRELIGIEKANDELLQLLMYPEGSKGLKIISIVGSGGMGKTTLADVVYEQLKVESFDCCAFVSVGRNPNITTTLREMLKQLLHKEYISDMNGERLCKELHESLKGKRYVYITHYVH
jgi:alcohol dehydrogenase class IV